MIECGYWIRFKLYGSDHLPPAVCPWLSNSSKVTSPKYMGKLFRLTMWVNLLDDYMVTAEPYSLQVRYASRYRIQSTDRICMRSVDRYERPYLAWSGSVLPDRGMWLIMRHVLSQGILHLFCCKCVFVVLMWYLISIYSAPLHFALCILLTCLYPGQIRLASSHVSQPSTLNSECREYIL